MVTESRKKTRVMLIHELSQIRKYMYAGASNRMIMEMLNIPQRTFYHYMETIAKQDLEAQLAQGREYTAMHINRCREDLLKMQRQCDIIISNPETEPQDKLDAMHFYAELAVNLLRLEHEGITLFQVIPKHNGTYDRGLVYQSNILKDAQRTGERTAEGGEGEETTGTKDKTPAPVF